MRDAAVLPFQGDDPVQDDPGRWQMHPLDRTDYMIREKDSLATRRFPGDDLEEGDSGRRKVNPQGRMDYKIRDKNDEDHCHQTKGESSQGPERNHEGEIVLLMQRMPDDSDAWAAYLQALQGELEQMDKTTRAHTAQTLLNMLDWHCTNAREGYWLGHMKGKVEQMTALLHCRA